MAVLSSHSRPLFCNWKCGKRTVSDSPFPLHKGLWAILTNKACTDAYFTNPLEIPALFAYCLQSTMNKDTLACYLGRKVHKRKQNKWKCVKIQLHCINMSLWIRLGYCTAVYKCVSPLAPLAGGTLTSLTVHYYFWYALCHSQLVPWVIVHCDWWPLRQHTGQPQTWTISVCLHTAIKDHLTNHGFFKNTSLGCSGSHWPYLLRANHSTDMLSFISLTHCKILFSYIFFFCQINFDH